jgi:hypothetical protein
MKKTFHHVKVTISQQMLALGIKMELMKHGGMAFIHV